MKNAGFYNLVKRTVRSLRKHQTEAEGVFWQLARNRSVSGKKFLRQHPIIFEYYGKKRFLIADFYCHEAKLIVEIDGGVHELQKEYDKIREHVLRSLGMEVVRFSNNEIMNNQGEILSKLKRLLSLPSSPSLEKRGG